MSKSFHVVFVSAPQGGGKSTNAEALMGMFDCTSVVDDWDGVSPVPDGALVLTSQPWPDYTQARAAE